jgi:hypothetical protein
VLGDDDHAAKTAALVVGNNNVALCLFARLLRTYRLLGMGADSCGTLVLGLASVCCNFEVSCPQALFFWHVSSITNEHIFHVNNAYFNPYLQICDFLNSEPTVEGMYPCIRKSIIFVTYLIKNLRPDM